MKTFALPELESPPVKSRGSGAQLDEAKVRTKIWVLYGFYVFVWCDFLYLLRFLRTSTRVLSPWILPAFAALGIYFIVSGALMRKKYFARTTVAAHGDASKALVLWWKGNIIGFSSAIAIAVLGFWLEFLGATWKVTAIFFGIGLVFLLLWRPRPLLR